MNSNNNNNYSYIFKTEIWLPQPSAAVFDFFQKAENLELLTPEWLNFKILTPLPITLKKGALIDYTLGLYGVRFKWRTKISNWNPPYDFSDIQIKGPYKRWDHTHSFEEKDGGTLMRDKVIYEVPGGFLAPIVNNLFVSQQVKSIFKYRETKIREIFRE